MPKNRLEIDLIAFTSITETSHMFKASMEENVVYNDFPNDETRLNCDHHHHRVDNWSQIRNNLDTRTR